MRYIDVASQLTRPKLKFDPIPLVVDLSDGVLVSLVKVCKLGKNRHLIIDANKIQIFKKNYLNKADSVLWVDSGGFNLLSEWEMSEELLESYIKEYCQYISQQTIFFEKVFSLDFPVAKVSSKADNSWFNSLENVKKWNLESQRHAVEAIKKSPPIRDKYVFIYQFRTPQLFKIWKEIYNELNLKEHVRHRAVGGLVGIHTAPRKAKRKALLFSPVIGPAFNCFMDYLEADDAKQNFSLHFLGVSKSIDQFVVIFLERLFTYYLSKRGNNTQACFSVDTRSHSKTMDLGSRTHGIYSFDPCLYVNKIHKDFRIRDIPDSRLRKAYTEHYQKYLSGEINDKLSWDERVDSTSIFYPLAIYSNNSLTNYFDWFIGYNNLLMLMLNAHSREDIESNVEELFTRLLPKPNTEDNVPFENVVEIAKNIDDDVKASIESTDLPFSVNDEINKLTPLYDIFKSPKYHNKVTNLDNKIKVSFGKIYNFHRWYVESGEPDSLEELMLEFIDDIGLEDSLQ